MRENFLKRLGGGRLLVLLILLLALPLTVLIGQKQQEIRQRAEGPEGETCSINLSKGSVNNSVVLDFSGSKENTDHKYGEAIIMRQNKEEIIGMTPSEEVNSLAGGHVYIVGSCDLPDPDRATCNSSVTVTNIPAGDYYFFCATSTDHDPSCSGNPFLGNRIPRCSSNDHGSFSILPPGNIAGYKVGPPVNGSDRYPPFDSVPVTLDGGSPTTTEPYNFSNVIPGNHTVAVTVPSGWTVGYTLCYAPNIRCHRPGDPDGYNLISASSAQVSVTGGGGADLWWHFTPPTPSGTISCTPDTLYIPLGQTASSTIASSYQNFVNGYPSADVCVSTDGGAKTLFAAGGGSNGSTSDVASWITPNHTSQFSLISLINNNSPRCEGTTIASCTVTGLPTTTPPPTNTPIPLAADVNRDGVVDIRDFNSWLYAFKYPGQLQNPTDHPDINGDKKVDLLDFSIWYKIMRGPIIM